MKPKLFFRSENSEHCHDKDYFIDEMKDSGMKEMVVLEALPDKGKDYFWCKAINDACLPMNSFDGCGVNCEDYDPCNGKSGKCRHKTHCYKHGNEVLISIK